MVDLKANRRRIGVFDSGVGGLSVLKALLDTLPHEDFDFVADERYLPYGDKPQATIVQRVLDLTGWLRATGSKAVVIACNTATAAAADQARTIHGSWPIIGIEPAIKPASLMTRTGVVGILATNNTVASERFQSLVGRFDPLATVVARPCPGLVELIETVPMPVEKVRTMLKPVVGELAERKADVIVLGCTHYPFIAHIVSELAGPDVAVIETGVPVARHLKTRLDSEGLLQDTVGLVERNDRVRFFTTGDADGFKRKLVGLLGEEWVSAQVHHLLV